jgi:hypothetical protein
MGLKQLAGLQDVEIEVLLAWVAGQRSMSLDPMERLLDAEMMDRSPEAELEAELLSAWSIQLVVD